MGYIRIGLVTLAWGFGMASGLVLGVTGASKLSHKLGWASDDIESTGDLAERKVS
jgi:hypothetical protein